MFRLSHRAVLAGNTIAGTGDDGSRGIATSGAAEFAADGNTITGVSRAWRSVPVPPPR